MVLARLAMATLSWEVIFPAATSLSPSFTLSMAACENSSLGFLENGLQLSCLRGGTVC